MILFPSNNRRVMDGGKGSNERFINNILVIAVMDEISSGG